MTRPTTLITGAAKRVGAQIARHLAARGHDIVLHYHRSQAEAEALAAELAAVGAHVTLLRADLSALDTLSMFWDGLPPVTTIIHNASQYERDSLVDMTLASLRTHMAVNLEAPLLLTQGFMTQLPAESSGSIIVLGDGMTGWSTSPEFFSYAVSKHAWASLIDLMASAVAPRARANVIALAPTLPNGDEEAMFERLAARSPLQRTGTLDEVCGTIDYLLGNPAITGQTISLANGMGLATKRG